MKADFHRNRRNSKGLIFIICFRSSNWFTKNLFLRFLGIPVRVLYRLVIQWLMGIDIPDSTIVGPGLVVFHGQGLVVNKDVVLGKNVTLRQNTTIGNARQNGECPRIGNNVNIGANVVVLGKITVGDNVVIGAGSVVTKNIPDSATVVGNPARILKISDNG